jgi:hypothetical protein
MQPPPHFLLVVEGLTFDKLQDHVLAARLHSKTGYSEYTNFMHLWFRAILASLAGYMYKYSL